MFILFWFLIFFLIWTLLLLKLVLLNLLLLFSKNVIVFKVYKYWKNPAFNILKEIEKEFSFSEDMDLPKYCNKFSLFKNKFKYPNLYLLSR